METGSITTASRPWHSANRLRSQVDSEMSHARRNLLSVAAYPVPPVVTAVTFIAEKLAGSRSPLMAPSRGSKAHPRAEDARKRELISLPSLRNKLSPEYWPELEREKLFSIHFLGAVRRLRSLLHSGGIELSPAYIELARECLSNVQLPLAV